MSDKSMTCKTCKYYKEVNSELGTGDCRYNPPVLVRIQTSQVDGEHLYSWDFPNVDSRWWCGRARKSLNV